MKKIHNNKTKSLKVNTKKITNQTKKHKKRKNIFTFCFKHIKKFIISIIVIFFSICKKIIYNIQI
ncbi:hypothetical protein AB837_00247 [bacterium AB1]|nr:hypothetical protein AB837_00247 [bacterium AB1]